MGEISVSKTAISLEDIVEQIDRESLPAGKAEAIAEKPEFEKKYQRRQYIRFFIEDILFALPLANALEIAHRPAITPLPNLPEWILGVTNVRGDIISVVDMKVFFGMASQFLKRDSRFIIVRHQEMKVGVIVDRVMGILSLDPSQIHPPPFEQGEIAPFISGVIPEETILINILNVEKLLTSSKLDAFRSE